MSRFRPKRLPAVAAASVMIGFAALSTHAPSAPAAPALPGQAPAETTTTTTPPEATTTTTAPEDTTTTTAPEATTTIPPETTIPGVEGSTPTTAPEGPPIPPPEQLINEAPTEAPPSTDVPVTTPKTSRGTDLAIPLSADELVRLRVQADEAQRRVDAFNQQMAAAVSELQAAEAVVNQARGRVQALTSGQQRAVSEAADARLRLLTTATEVMVAGGDAAYERLIEIAALTVAPGDSAVANAYLTSAADRKAEQLAEVEAAYQRLNAQQSALADELAAATNARDQVAERIRALVGSRDAAAGQAADLAESYQTSERFLVNWRLPVAAAVSFTNDWGFARSGGRTHEGTDIFAAYGAPVVAPEAGVIRRVGTNALGGQIVWMAADSGISYYFAHLSTFAPGLIAGQRVNGGDLIGAVGTSGNAAGTPPHLHFEVHPGGKGPVNPFPLLKLAKDTTLLVAARLGITPNADGTVTLPPSVGGVGVSGPVVAPTIPSPTTTAPNPTSTTPNPTSTTTAATRGR